MSNLSNTKYVSNLPDWIRHHQVVAFFLIAYLITWPLFTLIFFIFPGNQVVLVLFGELSVYSPALAAMAISAIAEPRPKQGSGKQRWSAFGVSWVIAWFIMTLYYWQVEKMGLAVAAILWAVFSLFPAWVLSSAFAHTPGIRKHFSTLIRPRGNLVWYLVAVLAVPMLQLLGAGITRLMGGVFYFRLEGMRLGQMGIFLVLTFLSGFLCSGGINEESGWRGFALPRLQARYPVIVSIGIVWFFWALWHLPYDFGQGADPNWILINRTLYTFTFSVLMAWVYNRTKGSILAPALFHPSMNTFGNNLPFSTAGSVLFVVLAVFAIVFDRMWKKLPAGDPAVTPFYQPDLRSSGEPTPVIAH